LPSNFQAKSIRFGVFYRDCSEGYREPLRGKPQGCSKADRDAPKEKKRKKWRTSLSPKAMGPRAVAGGKSPDTLVAVTVAAGDYLAF
jgi:hypothetical protein